MRADGDQQTDRSGWRDLRERFVESGRDADELEDLVDRLASRLIGHFGSDVIEIHHGKNDPTRHDMQEVAAAAIAHLLPVIEPDAGERIARVAAPWDDSWRADERTASWRS